MTYPSNQPNMPQSQEPSHEPGQYNPTPTPGGYGTGGYGTLPPAKKSKKGLIIGLSLGIGIPVFLIITCCGGCLIFGAMQPDSGVLYPAEMEDIHTTTQSNLLKMQDGENLLLFYDSSIDQDASEDVLIITDQRIFFKDPGGSVEIPSKDVLGYQTSVSGVFDDVNLEIKGKDGDYISLTIDSLDDPEKLDPVLIRQFGQPGYPTD